MSEYFAEDLREMHEKFEFLERVKALSPDMLLEFLRFRAKFIQEELDELNKAIDERNFEEIVDALIDIPVVALGTLDLINVDIPQAWTEVMDANMAKESGVNASRPNRFGLPDLIKPYGWQKPSHAGNHGILKDSE